MNGAEVVVRTLVEQGVNICFTNPGTSEMYLIEALDHVPEMRPVLVLFEGVASGAADGYARMAGTPACTLFHLGPGMANSVANFHNAKRANTPIVNIVGDHAEQHKAYNTPLQSDIEGLASFASGWVHTASSVDTLRSNTEEAVAQACQASGQVATLILPNDLTWLDGSVQQALAASQPQVPRQISDGRIEEVVAVLQSGEPTIFLMNGRALDEASLILAGRIAKKYDVGLYNEIFSPRLIRGAGVPKIDRLPYFPQELLVLLSGISHLVLLESEPPVSFFAYPDSSSWLVPESCQIHTLTVSGEDSLDALERLVERVNAQSEVEAVYVRQQPPLPSGPLTLEAVAQTITALMPEQAIVSDEAVTSGFVLYPLTANAAKHDWLNITGGAIGQGIPVATGAALACPDRKVIALEGDGSAMYTLQALWTQARENLDVTTIIFNNRAYSILGKELERMGSVNGQVSSTMVDLSPSLNFVDMAKGMGVQGVRVETAEQFNSAFKEAMERTGPLLIELMI